MTDSVRLARVDCDTRCLGCNELILYGTYAYVSSNSADAICINCGVERGWSDKQLVNKLVQSLELRRSIGALKKQQKVALDDLMRMKQEVQVYGLARKHSEVENAIVKTVGLVESYLLVCGSASEKEFFEQLQHQLVDLQGLQSRIEEIIDVELLGVGQKRNMKKANLIH